MKKPLVSIVITCYNYADYVAESIESALNQTYKNIEIIVINDGSTDNSLDIINNYKTRVKVISRKNKGIVFTRNQALDLVKGEFLCFLDADDYFDDDYIENMVKVAQENDADVVYPNWRIFGDEEYVKVFPEFDLEKLIQQEIHCTAESLIRLSSIGELRFESEKVAEDWDFFLGMALSGCKFKLSPESYINYRVKKGGRASSRDYWEDMYYFVEILRRWQQKYPKKVNPIDLPVYAGRLRDRHIESELKIKLEKERIINQLSEQLEEANRNINYLQSEVSIVRAERDELTNSVAYKTGNMIAKPIRLAKKSVKYINKKHNNIAKKLRDKKIDKQYTDQIEFLRQKNSHARDIAVVVHLFYTDNWPLFSRKLALLPHDKFDLYITMPKVNSYFIKTIQADYPDARIIFSPNRGRDVLPFMKTYQYIEQNGYKTILKFHSKKSTHWDGGQDWLETTLDQIIPDDKKVLKKIVEATEKANFGILGPADMYYPLTINLPANRNHVNGIINELFDQKMSIDITQTKRKDYGFFGGTMFWVNVESIKSLSRYSKAEYFEEEAGQIDGTIAHALERVFAVLPELEKKDVYQSDGKSVAKRPYASDNIPEWSEDHDK